MKISIITVFTNLHETFLSTGIISRAVKENKIKFNLVKLFDFIAPGERIDSSVCGPGAGMLIKPDVVEKSITHCENLYGKAFKVFFSPQGKKLTQKVLQTFSENFFSDIHSSEKNQEKKTSQHIILFCARYEGIDARCEDLYADAVISIGDYILMGGDLAAQVFLESLLRLLPGIVGNKDSIEQDSFSNALFDYPNYTRPILWKNKKVPEVVVSGNHKSVEEWRHKYACKNTVLKRFDWFRENNPTKQDLLIAKKYIPNHYVVVCHSNVVIKNIGEGDPSIASLDIHDIARSSRTYSRRP